ncbi:WhiB family transcriptional regulator [Streptomyces sp. NPDC087297]|uniref:WhiB family transcriptional regulator n=1 Tax=Streptomyces sp. NPDC087297 TaxID=3365778 RepID=UPI0037F2643F
MTTAVLTSPVAPARGSHWADLSACRTADADGDFFGEDPRAQARAREVCLTCPVLLRCLADRASIDGADSWGVVGGLEAAQRRALAVAELLGEYPDLTRAQELIAPRRRYRLHSLRRAGCTPGRIAELLTAEGFTVDAVTVRVALWWTGDGGTLLARRPRLDQRSMWERVRDDHADVIRLFQEHRVRMADAADYLGIGIGTYNRVVQDLKAAA